MNIPIQDVSLFPVTTPRVSGEPSQHVVVKLTAADGTVGWGEMSDLSHLPAMMPDVRDLQCCLKSLLVGRDVMATNAVEDAMLANFPGTRFHGKACLVRAGVSIIAERLRLLRAAQLGGFVFYCYGMAAVRHLEWLRRALRTELNSC